MAQTTEADNRASAHNLSMTAVSAHGLAEHLAHLRSAPRDVGSLDLVVRRTADGREVLSEAELDRDGLVGDLRRDGLVTVMPSRMAALLGATDLERALTGNQLHVDLDLSVGRLPVGGRLCVGDAVLEVVDRSFGSAKFRRRFGPEAAAFVSSETGVRLRLRGLWANVVAGGVIRRGDVVRHDS